MSYMSRSQSFPHVLSDVELPLSRHSAAATEFCRSVIAMNHLPLSFRSIIAQAIRCIAIVVSFI